MKYENSTAIHEAGHVVANIRLGIDHGEATIERNGDTVGSANSSDFFCNEHGAKRQVISLCSGYAACVAAGLDEDDSREGCSKDFEEAEDILRGWNMGSLDNWLRKAVRLMTFPRNRKAVTLISNNLLEHKRLAKDYLYVLMEYSDGDSSAEEFALYLSDMLAKGLTPQTC